MPDRMGKVFLFFTILATVTCKYKYHPEGVKSYVHDSDEWVRDTTRFVDETTFPLDPLNALDENLSSGQDVIRENQKWLAKIQMNDAQANFIYDMINVRHSLVFTPSINNLRGKDDFEYCWVILAYNSDIPKLYDGKQYIFRVLHMLFLNHFRTSRTGKESIVVYPGSVCRRVFGSIISLEYGNLWPLI